MIRSIATWGAELAWRGGRHGGVEGMGEGVRAVTVPGTPENNRYRINKVNRMIGVEDVVMHLATIRFGS